MRSRQTRGLQSDRTAGDGRENDADPGRGVLLREARSAESGKTVDDSRRHRQRMLTGGRKQSRRLGGGRNSPHPSERTTTVLLGRALENRQRKTQCRKTSRTQSELWQ